MRRSEIPAGPKGATTGDERGLNHLFGGSLLLAGFLLAGWAVVTVNAIDVAKPPMIIITGPYTFSRNPR